MAWAQDRLALHTWSLDTTPLADALAAAKAGGFNALELRRIDYVRCIERGLSEADVNDLVSACGLPVCTLGVEYGILFARGEESNRLFDVFHRSCRNAKAIGCPQLMSAPGPITGPMREAIANLKTAADMAAAHGLELAIEFNSQHETINSVARLAELVEGADRKNCGMLLDAYHLHRSGSPGRGFADVPGERIIAFQYSDCAQSPVTGVKRPTDRLLPGEGVVRWGEVLGLLAEKGYRGHLSYEAPNPALWARPPVEVARAAAAATRRLLAGVRAP